MRLELRTFQTEDVQFGPKTRLEKGVLTVNKEELRGLVLEDSHFADVEIQVAKPGDNTRITHVRQVAEPRWKVEGAGQVFPGFVGPPVTVGDGKTNRLAGTAVATIGEAVPGERTRIRQTLIDMSGPGAQYGPFGKTVNVVINLKPNLDLFQESAESLSTPRGTPQSQAYDEAARKATLKAAAYLGKVTEGMAPQKSEVFELGPCDPALLKVAVVYQQTRPTIYGAATGLTAATLVHPNESFDGALVPQQGTCYLEQNNEILMELCRRHGKELNFVGYVLFGDTTPALEQKERVSSNASKMVHLLGAQAALLLGQNGSNLAIDLMWTLQKCERAGVKTTLAYMDVGTGAEDPGFIFFVPEADAIVNVGTREQPVRLPAMKKVIGGQIIEDHAYVERDASGELNVTMRYVHGALNVLGLSHITTRFC